MQRRAVEPGLVVRPDVEIHDGCKAEREVGAGHLRSIGSPQLWMGSHRIVIQGRGVTDMHVRVDQARDQEPAGAIDPLCRSVHHEVRANFSDLAISDNNIRMDQRGGAFRRDDDDIRDYRAVSDNALRLGTSERSSQNKKWSQPGDEPTISGDQKRHGSDYGLRETDGVRGHHTAKSSGCPNEPEWWAQL